MRAELGLCVLLAGCTVAQTLSRPEGDGGWTPAERETYVADRAAAAGVPRDGAESELPEHLDLPAALALAVRRNRHIAEAERDVAAARERVWNARGRLLPATTGSGRYTRYTDQQTTAVELQPGLLAPGVTPPDVIIRDLNSTVLNGTLTIPLDLSGELYHALKAAQAGYRGEEARQWATTLTQQVGVVRAYFRLLAAQRLREVTEQTIALERTQLAHADARFEEGRLTKNELLVVQVALRNAEQELLQRDLAIAEARWALNEVVGLAVDRPTTVVDVVEPPHVPPAGETLRQAYATNPVLRALVEEQQRLDAVTTSLVRQRLPRVSGGGAIDWAAPEIISPQTVGSGFVGFTWDLGTDGRREADIAAARIAAERNRLVTERELREIESAVRTTQRAAEERLSALATAAEAVGQAEENLRIRQQQFDAGRATSEDVLDAEALLTGQRATLATALYDAHTRRAELQRLMGLPLDELVLDVR